ncbi:probable inactive poly [ADP-ribose] polymerase SRO3 [Cucurbita pepo subsp. pepo]|uniref:probable inactive poly [ADP-ribose] polymerase SRO3 n=1 Tax=Cucurbita pepo subsp. pepo TaxID=3664 RepID=UPI000C9D9836|nr:probable inactive poly [ADP-ribose] polymerase SRO3 [Cucurbita pepo subsp. pepo]XP_023537458.1 probable inactive poly [ADP-ribose] polymerase SRO3 [Cucurbita pepo subsp. pepo]
MASSKLLMHKQFRKKMVESVAVRAPPRPCSRNPIDSSSCNHLSDSSQSLIQNYSNFKASGLPSRFMFYQDRLWVDFDTRVIGILRAGFSDRNPAIELEIDGSTYLFDMYRMLQIDLETGRQRSVAWIDENGKCFFPKVFIGDESEGNTRSLSNPKIEIEIKIDGKSGKRKREAMEMKEEENEVSSSNEHVEVKPLKIPRVVANDSEAHVWPKAKALSEGDSAYTLVSNFFLPSMKKVDPSSAITSIHQCTRTGPLEKARLDVFQKQNEITTAARGVSNMVYAWYGASATSLAGILAHGFGEPLQVPAADTHGIGVYLSPLGLPHLCSTLSEADEDGIKHMVLCRVILGNVEKVEAGSQQSHPSSTEFDTGVDDPTCPKRYIVWCSNMNRHILPEYIVSFRSNYRLPGKLGESTDTKYSLVKLLSKMKNSLPTSKVQEVATLFQTFKAGKLGKDVLVKRLRSIAGDDMLLSLIREIRECQ